MTRKLFLLHLLCFCCLLSAQATGQIPDLIIIGKDTLMLQTCPIEHDSILSKQVSKRLSNENSCTACWRGYQALWQIEDDKLILKRIEDSKSLFAHPDTVPEVTVDLNGIFDQYQDKQGRVVASWFSGELKVVSGKQIYYVHMGFNREYENETDYQVEQGRVISKTDYRNSIQKGTSIKDAMGFAMTQFNGDRFPELANTRVVLSGCVLPKADGSIDSINIEIFRPDSITEERKNLYTEQICTILKKVPQWDVLTVRNKIWKTDWWTLPVWNGKGCKANYLEGQIMDTLSYNDTIYALRNFPLQYDMNLYEKVKPYIKKEWRSNCFRGYTGQWKIEDGKLYLINRLHPKDNSPLPLDSIFGLTNRQPIEASWYSGKLHLIYGDSLGDNYEWRKIYTKEVQCEVKAGKITQQKIYNNFLHPGDWDALVQCEQELQRPEVWSKFPKLQDKSVRCRYWVVPRLDGTADSITCNVYVNGCDKKAGSKRYHKEITDEEHPYVKIFKKALQAIPKWEVLYVHSEIRKYEGWIDGKDCEE